MKKNSIVRQDTVVVEGRFLWASIVLLVVSLGILFRLWFIQVYRGDYYAMVSEKNRMRKIEIPVPRGIIYDRYGEVILGNRPFFDLVFIPQYVANPGETVKLLSRLLHVPVSTFERKIKQAQGNPKFLPIYLKRNLSLHEVSTIENNKLFLPGIEVKVAPRRDYREGIPVHMLGYLREIDPESLASFNAKHEDNPYEPGDLVGKQGIEARWEEQLRGQRGYQLIQVDAFGRQTQPTDAMPWQLPVQAARPGSDLELTIDMELQKIANRAFNGKYGAVVAINPQNGEVLAMLSSPGFDPEQMQSGLSSEDWRALTTNPFKPFLDKTTGGEFPPGSVYKPVVAMAALEEGIITPQTSYFCPGYFTLGGQVFSCHDRKGHGRVDLRRALVKSCDVFFYHAGVELGVDRIAKYAKALGLGRTLGMNLNMERPGLIPTSAWKQLVHRLPWAGGDTPNISIGQGYNLITPIQMANLYATIANGGHVFRPHIVKRLTNYVGETVQENSSEEIKSDTLVKPKTFELIRGILQDVVMTQEGTGKKAQVPGQTVGGKTGSVQVVSLKKNRNRTDVSVKWKEHAMFAAFSPVEHAEIAVAIVSENDAVGGGGASAAPVAGEILRGYYELKAKRQGKPIAHEREIKHDVQQ